MVLRNESTERRGGRDMAMKREQFRRDGNAGEEDSCAIEETHRIQLDRNRR